MRKLRGPYTSSGENFVEFLRRRHIGGEAWGGVSRALIATGLGEEWSEAIREIALLHLARQLISAANVIVDSRPQWDYVSEREIKQMLLEAMVIDHNEVNPIYSRLETAIRASRSEISPGARTQLTKESKREYPWCYLCGTDLEYSDKESYNYCTLDHVWPRALGGESDFENLLPSCKVCNEKKGYAGSWMLYPIQSQVHGYRLDENSIQRAPKELRFAALCRQAAYLAEADDISLKEAFRSLGRPIGVEVASSSKSVDVFNLAIQFQ